MSDAERIIGVCPFDGLTVHDHVLKWDAVDPGRSTFLCLRPERMILERWIHARPEPLGAATAEPLMDGPTLLAQVETLTAEVERLYAQVGELAAFIQREVPGEPSQSQGAVETAIRVIRTRDAALAEALGLLEEVREIFEAGRVHPVMADRIAEFVHEHHDCERSPTLLRHRPGGGDASEAGAVRAQEG